MRRTLVCLGAGLVVVLVAALLTTALDGPAERYVEPDTRPLDLEAEQIYPSLARRAVARAVSYRELFEPGQTMAKAAEPACRRYRAVRQAWASRATHLDESSRGAGVSKRAARVYYANVSWVSQDEADDFDRALYRISRSRLSVTTGQVVTRRSLVAGFTRDALDLCGVTAAHARTRTKLERLDRRITLIIQLSRLDSGPGLAEGAAQ